MNNLNNTNNLSNTNNLNSTLDLKNNRPSVDGGNDNTDMDTLEGTLPRTAPGAPSRADSKSEFKLPADDEENASKREVDE